MRVAKKAMARTKGRLEASSTIPPESGIDKSTTCGSSKGDRGICSTSSGGEQSHCSHMDTGARRKTKAMASSQVQVDTLHAG